MQNSQFQILRIDDHLARWRFCRVVRMAECLRRGSSKLETLEDLVIHQIPITYNRNQ